MQNRPLDTYKVIYDHVHLKDDFPVDDLFKELLTISSEPVTLMHFHNVLEIGFCYEGCGLFFVDGGVMPFSAGDVSVILPEQVHVAQSDKSLPSHWDFIMLDPIRLLCELNIADVKLLSDIFSGNANISNIVKRDDPSRIADIVRRIFEEMKENGPHYKIMVKALVWELMITLTRADASARTAARSGRNHDIVKISPALNFISDNYTNPIRITRLAKVCSLSATHFRRLFSSALGKSPSDYLFEVRIKMASILLVNSDYSVLDIAMNVGYSTLSSFNRHFKKLIGMSPRQWREEHRPRKPAPGAPGRR